MGSVFRDVAVEPTDAAIAEALGPHAAAWEAVSALFADSGVAVSWRHYRDGGWLAKAVAGRRTVAWLAVEDGFVGVTFFFAERHRSFLRDVPGLDDETRERVATAPLSARLLPVAFEVRDPAELVPVRAVLAFKLTAR